jgi:predicted Zn-dependent peptidase
MRKGSRLHRALVREREVAAEAAAFTFDLTTGSDLLIIDVTARPGVSAERLETETAHEVDQLRQEGVTGAEVARAVALIETDFTVAMQSAGERADRLSQFATYFGEPRLVNAQVENYRAVTEDQVNAFVRTSLGEDNRASLLYVPRNVEATV